MLDWFIKKETSPIAEAFATEHDIVATGQPGFIAGTMVATSHGWRPVEALVAGDTVLTFDHGMQPIKSIKRERFTLGQTADEAMMSAIYIPRDVLGNNSPIWVRADQGVMIEHDLVEDALGDPFAVVPAAALEGYRGIKRAETQVHMDLITLVFDEDEIIYIEAGLLAYCPSGNDLLHRAFRGEEDLYTVLSPIEARELVIDMITEDSFWAPSVTGSGGHGAPQYAA